MNVRDLIELSTVKAKIGGALTPRIDIDASKIDIYNYPEWSIREDWKPELTLPPFDTTSKVYLDIETYSDNGTVARALYRDLSTPAPIPSHKPMIEYLCSIVDAGVKEYLTARLTTPHQSNDDRQLAAARRYIKENIGEIEQHPLEIDPRGSLDANKGRIVLIGMMNERGRAKIINCEEVGEAEGITAMFNTLREKKPMFLPHFNGFDFDLQFIITRCKLLGIKHPFYVSDKITCFKVAKRYSEPVKYNNIWLSFDGQHIAIIDLYRQALAWDNVNRKLTSFTLKNIVIDLGLRQERRLELPHERMKEIVKSGDLSELIEYLTYDLEDTKLVGELLLPDIYYQIPLLPDWKLQSIATGGNGSKWNHILTEEYKKLGVFSPPASTTKHSYEGGLTGGKAGLYRNVSKIDVASLYPTIMLLYGVCSDKDKQQLALQILYYLKVERLRLKAIAATKKGTDEGRLAKQMQGSLKVMINSLYGALGTQGIEFNDYVAAALVTAYGRAILLRMIEAIKDAGGIVASLDTDGVYYASESLEKNKEIWQKVQSVMPKTDREAVTLEYELEALAFYVPESTTKNAEDGAGAKKSYIIIDKNGKLKANGNYRKRDKAVLEKTYTPDLVTAYLKNEHEQLHRKTTALLLMKKYPIENLSITRKIRKGEKKLVELGLGKEGDIVTIWRAKDKPVYSEKTGKLLKKVDTVWTDNPKEIDFNYYYNMVVEQWESFLKIPKY